MFAPEMTRDDDGYTLCAPMLGEIDGSSPTVVLVSALESILADVQNAQRRAELVAAVAGGEQLDADDLAWLANENHEGVVGGEAYCAIQAIQELIELARGGAFR